jgi:YaiO family outer membrane protein
VGSLVSFDRPTGCGVVGSVGKYQEFSGGYGFLGVGSSRGAAYLPTLQVTTDLDLELPIRGLVLGAGLNYTRVRDTHQDWQAALGPTLYLGGFVSTARVVMTRSFPEGQDSTGGQVQIRHGLLDYQAWQSLRVTWGAEAYENLVVQQNVEARGADVAADFFFVLDRNWTLKTGLEWAQQNSAYRLWGANVEVGWMFR